MFEDAVVPFPECIRIFVFVLPPKTLGHHSGRPRLFAVIRILEEDDSNLAVGDLVTNEFS